MPLDRLRVDFWNKIDEEAEAVYPWFTHPCLDFISKLDLSEKRALEFGAGRGTRWWRTKCKWVVSVDANEGWIKIVQDDCLDGAKLNGQVLYRTTESVEGYFSGLEELGPYGVVVVDGEFRDNELEFVLGLKRKTPVILIADNWRQAFVWMSDRAVELMAPYEPLGIFPQPGHKNHDGVNVWKTAVWEIPPNC